MRTVIPLFIRSTIIFGAWLVANVAAAQPSAAPATPRKWTLEELFQRNVGSDEKQHAAFPPHKVVDNIWYVGTESLASFLITTPQGHILINSSYEANVRACSIKR
jgi:hypothetical protein